MNAAPLPFDRILADVLQADGPQSVPASFVDDAIAAARSARQRRPLVAAFDRQAWPAHPWDDGAASVAPDGLPRARRRARGWVLAIAGLLLVALMAGVVLVVGLPTPGPTDIAPTPTPSATAGSTPAPTIPPSFGPIVYAEAFVTLAPLQQSRDHPIVAALPDGRAWIAGGQVAVPDLASAIPSVVYDAGTGASEALAGDAPPGWGTSVVLPDGRVFAVSWDSNLTTSVAFLVAPDAGTSVLLGVGNQPLFGVAPGLAVIPGGRVLVAGGKADYFQPEVTDVAHIFDPASNRFVATSPMLHARIDQAMVTLGSGDVLVAGGGRIGPPDGAGTFAADTIEFDGTAELFDARSGTFREVPDLGISGPLGGVLLADGRVLLYPVMGAWARRDGNVTNVAQPLVSDTRLYDPVGGAFELGPSLPPGSSAAVRLGDDRVLVVGWTGSGGDDETYERWAVIWDVASGTVTPIDPPDARDPGVAVLADGRVILAGGSVGDRASLSHRSTLVQLFQ